MYDVAPETALHERLICVLDADTAVNPVGVAGGHTGVAEVVAAPDVPPALLAVTE